MSVVSFISALGVRADISAQRPDPLVWVWPITRPGIVVAYVEPYKWDVHIREGLV